MAQMLFISHASEDGPAVQRIVAYLERGGITCWIAGRDIPPRSVYAEAIAEGVKNASAFAVIVSRAANASAAVKRELELASHYGRAFIPIRIDDTKPGPGMDYYLNNVQWMEYKRDGDAALDRIIAHMRDQPYSPPPRAARRGRPQWVPWGLGAAAITALAFATIAMIQGQGPSATAPKTTIGASTTAPALSPPQPKEELSTATSQQATPSTATPTRRAVAQPERERPLVTGSIAGAWQMLASDGTYYSQMPPLHFSDEGTLTYEGEVFRYARNGNDLTWVWPNGTLWRLSLRSDRLMTGTTSHPDGSNSNPTSLQRTN